MTARPARSGRRQPTESATARLDRLLTMVPWLLRRPGVDIADAAAEFGVSTDQIEADLALIFLCGTPGGMPDDLIEAEWEGGKVYLGNADTIARPLRLGLDEAITLIVGLRTLADVPGLSDRHVVEQALAKLEQATGTASAGDVDAATARIHVDIAPVSEGRLLTQVRDALAGHRRLHLRYLVPSRDESTEREVDPVVELSLAAPSRWVGDYYPNEWLRDAQDGSAVVGIRSAQVDWLGRLVWQHGGGAVVLAPADLAQWVLDGADQALAWYDRESAPTAAPVQTRSGQTRVPPVD